jgi:hypothetical protein
MRVRPGSLIFRDRYSTSRASRCRFSASSTGHTSLGYSVAGDVGGQVLPFFFGAGKNGKSPRLRQYTDDVEHVRVLYFVTALGDFDALVCCRDGRRSRRSLATRLLWPCSIRSGGSTDDLVPRLAFGPEGSRAGLSGAPRSPAGSVLGPGRRTPPYCAVA